MKLYKYTYTGNTAWSVMGRHVKKAGDVIELPIKFFRHPWFRPEEESLFPVTDLKDVGKGKTLLLIGGGDSAVELQESVGEYDEVMLVNINKTKIKPNYIVYLEDAYIRHLEKNPIDDEAILIANELTVCNRANYFYNNSMVKEGHGAGFYALQIAQKILGYKEIKIIGFDLYGDDREWQPLIDDYKEVKWGKGIAILNPNSKLNDIIGGKKK